MTQQPPDAPQANLILSLPPEKAAGHYADFASIWHNNETFVLDFSAMTSPPMLDGDSLHVPAEVVARIRIPAEQVWEVMKALTQQLGQWEQEHPDRRPAEPPM